MQKERQRRFPHDGKKWKILNIKNMDHPVLAYFLYYTIRQRHEKLLISDDKQYLMPINISLTYKTFLLIFPTLKIDENSYLLIIIVWFPFMKKEVVLF